MQAFLSKKIFYFLLSIRKVDIMLVSRIKTLAENRGETLKTIAIKLGFGENAIYKWDAQSPKAENLEKVADFFGVSTDYLLGRTDDYEIETLAAHHDGEEWTEEELDEIERFKQFVKMKRSQ